MKLHNCSRCGYSTNIFKCFQSHLQRKYKCKPKLSDIPIELLKEELKNMSTQKSCNTATRGFLYMLREREFLKTNEQVYKVGKTTQQIHKRMGNYPKNSELILAIKFQNCHQSELELLKLMRCTETIKQRKDIGNEYFEGDENEIIKSFFKLVDRL